MSSQSKELQFIQVLLNPALVCTLGYYRNNNYSFKLFLFLFHSVFQKNEADSFQGQPHIIFFLIDLVSQLEYNRETE